ncbi:hypothetical protein CARUB_v10007367mg [Capsella rubella]|uniref:Lsm14-like N-terminal domain-containing protein n=1 Tax=Capsella rubella TaxID=81985 RepID=R0H275_9BRAS|nr:uncharacterized protein LOC17880294 [Capsella rubella]EOA18770.1 hypothetical protein CARUB_v10007367mg [Capsella rubella]
METDQSSQHPSPRPSSSTPPRNPVESLYLGSFVALISNYELRYEGILYHLNLQDSTLGLQNVICYGTEGRGNNEFDIHPYNKVYDYILFSGADIKEIIVKPPTSLTNCGYCLARGTTCSKSCQATKPPLPMIVSSNNRTGAKLRQKLLLTPDENIIKPQAMIDPNVFSVMGSVNDGVHIASQPQFPDSSKFYNPYVYQAPMNAAISTYLPHDPSASQLTYTASQSFFTTFPPAPVSIPQKYGRFGFDAKNVDQYYLWGPAPPENKIAKPAYYIDGSSYKISRKPFEPIGRPCNPFGPITRPVKHNQVFGNYLQGSLLQLQPPPSNFIRGFFYTPC